LRSSVTAVALLALATAATATAAPRPLRLGDRTLAPGAVGRDVRELQRTLTRLGLGTPVNGVYETLTVAGVQRYERREDLPVDGVVSRGEADGMRRRAGTMALGSRTLRRGSRGRDVRRLQGVLGDLGLRSAPDGVFGGSTERAVRRWERAQHVRVDGVVSPAQARRMVRSVAGRHVPAATPQPPSLVPGTRRFPIAGPYTFAGEGGRFGDRGGDHRGQDVFAACGTPLVAVESGTVRFVNEQARAGHYVVLHGAESGQDYFYAHMAAPASLAKGAGVLAGQPVGVVGRTGNATACHLHVELWTAPGWYVGGQAIDPLPALRLWGGAG
jgi:murein DD-endopeptidase MepM/ murein hydrolase activator NlpD